MKSHSLTLFLALTAAAHGLCAAAFPAQGASATDAALLEHAKETLRLGTIRIRTPRNTDFMFRIGMRPFHVSTEGERILLLRVAPVEQAVFGQISLPELSLGGITAASAVIEVDNGRITRIRAAETAPALMEALKGMGEAAAHVAEFSLGFDSRAAEGPTARGTVCIGFGGNEKLGGTLPGRVSHRYCLSGATVHVDFRYLLRDGALVQPGRGRASPASPR